MTPRNVRSLLSYRFHLFSFVFDFFFFFLVRLFIRMFFLTFSRFRRLFNLMTFSSNAFIPFSFQFLFRLFSVRCWRLFCHFSEEQKKTTLLLKIPEFYIFHNTMEMACNEIILNCNNSRSLDIQCHFNILLNDPNEFQNISQYFFFFVFLFSTINVRHMCVWVRIYVCMCVSKNLHEII